MPHNKTDETSCSPIVDWRMRLGALALCLSAWTAVGLGDAMAAVPPLLSLIHI